MIRFTSILLLLCIAWPSVSSAQKYFLDGFVVTNSGDTIYGKIKDRKDGNFEKLYGKIRFKKGIWTKRYGAHKIQSYCKGNECFKSFALKRSGTLFNEKYTLTNRKNTFLKVIAEGRLSLYHMEYFDFDERRIDYIPLFYLERRNHMIRATQGLFGIKQRAVLEYLNYDAAIDSAFQNKEIKSLLDVLRIYN